MAGKNPITVLNEAEAGLNKVNNGLKTVVENILKANDAALKMPKNFFGDTTPNNVNEKLKERGTITLQLNAYLKEKVALEKALIKQTNKVVLAEKGVSDALVKQRYELQQLNQRSKETAVLSSKLSTEYQKQSTRLNILRRNYKDVALSQGESSKQAKKLLTQITALDNRLKRVDANVGQFQRSVGNYGKAMRGAVGAARNLASAMGFVGGAFLAIGVIRDAFSRVREFDKEMQNMAGILRTTRPELKEVEDRIIAVAASSIKTSNEVAKLSTSLFVLGKTKDEVLDLIEPVNNLSIALGATSEETGEFLVQVLNSFGAGSESALEYADTIAAIRTSTSLNFQKMRDSFQYIAPISKILNKDLAYTGAVVGVLADNGLKAESAGRLLATAQIKLATSGKTLQEGLDEINKAYVEGKEGTELLTIANSLFGKQAAKIGVILATQQERLEEYDEKIRKAGGSLDDLVNEQLKSVDAQLKITASVWEEFILSIENGEGALSSALSGFLSGLNDLIKGFTLLNKTSEEYNDYLRNEVLNDTLKEVSKAYKDMGDDAESSAIKEADAARDRVDAINKEIQILKDRNKELNNKSNFGTGFRKSASLITAGLIDSKNPEIEENEKAINDLSAALGYQQGVLKASENVISKVTDEIDKNTDGTNKNKDAKIKNIAFLREQIKHERERLEGLDLENEAQVKQIPIIKRNIAEYQKQIDAILKNGKAKKQNTELIKGSISHYNNLIKILTEKRDKLAITSEAYKEQTERINAVKEAIKALQGIENNSGLTVGLNIEDEDAFKNLNFESIKVAAENLSDKLGVPIEQLYDEFSNLYEYDYQNFVEFSNKKIEQSELEEQKKKEALIQGLETAGEFTGALGDLTSTLFDRKIQKYEDDINKNNDYYANLLDNEKLSESQRSALEAERDKKNLQLEKKKRAEQTKQAKFAKAFAALQIGLQTSIAVISALSAPPIGLGPVAGIPLAITTGALGAIQLATALASPIPQYAEGKNVKDSYEGAAIWGEKRRELKISADGSMELSPKKIANHLTHVKSDDIIIPDANKYLSNLSDNDLYNNIHKHAILSSVAHQNNTINEYLLSNSIDKSFEKHSKRMTKAMKDNRPVINVRNNNSIGSDIAFLARLNNTL